MGIKPWKMVVSALIVAIAVLVSMVIVVLLPVVIPTIAQAVTTDPTICTAPAGKLPKTVPEPFNSISTRVGKEKNIPNYAVALVYWSENGWEYREPPPPYGKGRPYESSPAGARGPMQFLSNTYHAFRFANPHNKPGNIMDLTDAMYAAGAYLRDYGKLRKNSPIGDPKKPQKGTLMWALGAYNAGPGGNFSNSETSRYLERSAVEARRLLAGSPKVENVSSVLINLCKELSDPPPTGREPAGSCPKGTLGAPEITTVGIGNPRQGTAVLLCRVGGITVNAKIVARWQWLIAKARSQGITLSGGGFRSYESQIALRKAHCGTSEYAIYQMSARACSPDTARPGTSFHETGHAVDLRMSKRVYGFMQRYGPEVGIYRTVPSEWWHWSTKTRI